MILWLPLVCVVAGLLIYVLASNGKVSELGRIMFFCGLLVAVWEFAGRTAVFGDEIHEHHR